MPTANVRYGRPKGSGRDDRQQLASIAALLAADPKLKPTTAIRSLGIDNPSEIRRLRDKFRIDQAHLMAEASRAKRVPGGGRPSISSNENTPPPKALQLVEALPPPTPERPRKAVKPAVSDLELIETWCELGFKTLSAALENQCAFAQYWLRLPPVAMAVRSQLTCHAVAVAILDRSKGQRACLN